MELKDIMILLTIFLTAFVMFSSIYVNVTDNYSVNGASQLSIYNESKYSEQLDDVRSGAYDDFQNATEIGSVGKVLDTLGAIVESGFGVATQSVESAEDSTELISDMQTDLRKYLIAAVFGGLMAILFLILLFGLIRLLTGR